MLKIFKIIVQISLLLLLITTLPTWASSQERWGTQFDDLFEEKQMDVKIKKNDNGTETRELVLTGGVLVKESRKGSKITNTLLLDQSGLGAILCARSIYLSAKIWLDVCDDFNNSKSSKRLNTAINRVHKFIVNNSMSPVSIDELNAHINSKANRLRTVMLGAQKKTDSVRRGTLLECRGKQDESLKFIEQMSNRIAELSEKEFEQSIDKLLSVPRLPVWNPCI